MKTKQTLGLCTVLLFALFALATQARPQKAVLNAAPASHAPKRRSLGVPSHW